jgi:hypothetical protein
VEKKLLWYQDAANYHKKPEKSANKLEKLSRRSKNSYTNTTRTSTKVLKTYLRTRTGLKGHWELDELIQ